MPSLKSLTLVGATSLIALAAPLAAQQTAVSPPRTGKGEIDGVVVDSLNTRYLEGADVLVSGATAHAVTDSNGRFRLEGLAPGTYRLGVFHPLLDTLGLSIESQPFHVGPDSVSTVVFAIPSASSIIRGACPANARAEGNSAVVGHVDDAETMQPVAGVEVSVAWVELEVSKQTGFHRTPHTLRDTTNAAGEFHLCGLPNSTDATLKAVRGAAVTSEIPIPLGDADPELLAKTMLLSRADSTVTVGNASVRGTVTLEGSTATAGTRVELAGTSTIAMTDAAGQFVMSNIPAGTHTLVARHLGFAADVTTVDLQPGVPQQVTMKLPRYVTVMDPVLVRGRRIANLDRIGFTQRQKTGAGHYLGPEDLEKMHPAQLTDIFRRVPGLRVKYTPDGDEVTTLRQGGVGFINKDCIRFFLDDVPWQSVVPGDINSFINAEEIVAVEVYQATNTPAQYTFANGDCTTVVLWTKDKFRDVRGK